MDLPKHEAIHGVKETKRRDTPKRLGCVDMRSALVPRDTKVDERTGLFGRTWSAKGRVGLFGHIGLQRGVTHPKDVTIHKDDVWSPRSCRMGRRGKNQL
jgi:hypothetical protein